MAVNAEKSLIKKVSWLPPIMEQMQQDSFHTEIRHFNITMMFRSSRDHNGNIYSIVKTTRTYVCISKKSSMNLLKEYSASLQRKIEKVYEIFYNLLRKREKRERDRTRRILGIYYWKYCFHIRRSIIHKQDLTPIWFFNETESLKWLLSNCQSDLRTTVTP